MMRRCVSSCGPICSSTARWKPGRPRRGIRSTGSIMNFPSRYRSWRAISVLALNRGEREGWLKINVRCDEAGALILLRRHVIRPGSRAMAFLQGVCQDAYTRLLQPSLERELRASLTEMANTGAIHNFALNLRPLLLQPPVKDQVTMGLDPGYRNGCKLAVVDPTGKVLDTVVIYPTAPQNKVEQAKKVLKRSDSENIRLQLYLSWETERRPGSRKQIIAELFKGDPRGSCAI